MNVCISSTSSEDVYVLFFTSGIMHGSVDYDNDDDADAPCRYGGGARRKREITVEIAKE